MKKLLCILLAAVLCVCLTACNGNQGNGRKVCGKVEVELG